MAVYTCTRGGERAETAKILRASGEVEAIVCPVHGVIAWLGFKPANGDLGSRVADGTTTLQPGEYAKVGTNWLARPPRGNPFWVGLPITVNADNTITLSGFLDGSAWRGWLEGGVWIEEER